MINPRRKKGRGSSPTSQKKGPSESTRPPNYEEEKESLFKRRKRGGQHVKST